MEYLCVTPTEMEYLKKKDKRLGAVIDALGPIRREGVGDLFEALVFSVVGQQISSKAQATVWNRFLARFEAVTPDAVLAAGPEGLCELGISGRKAGYICSAAEKIVSGRFDMDALDAMPDEELLRTLTALDGVGVWTAEMLMLFSMKRKNVLSYGDYGIRKGLRMLYHHREVTPALFEKYKKRYSPYGSAASLYLWAIAGGALPQMRDYAPKKGGK